jgi:N-acetylneuraminate synthase
VEDIPINTKIESHHIRSVRPGKGLPPKEIDRVIGSTLKVSVKKGTPVSWDVLF